MTAPEHPGSGLDSNARGIIVVVVAVLIGIALLFKVGDGGSSDADPTPQASTPTIDVGGDDSTTTAGTTDTGGLTTTTEGSSGSGGTARPAGEVSVLVLNGSGLAGVAGTTSDSLGASGYVMGEPANTAAAAAGTLAETTSVYYAEGYQADAEAVASLLGKSADAVKPMPDTEVGPGAASANVVVELGQDTSPN